MSALERDQHNENSRGSKLRDLLLDDRELIPDMFAGAEAGVARDAMRRLMLTPVFDELTKRSLLARIIKLYPELESVITGEQKEEKSDALVVSWSSLDKRKAEYEELVNKKIPENSKEIGVARSYGDLRENFEFKAAKEMQAVLMRRKSELEAALHSARGTAFESPDTTQVSIGTIVTLRDSDSGKEEIYTVLGAWDGDPDRGIISYQTAIGQALLGHKVGEMVTSDRRARDPALRDHFDRACAGRRNAAGSVADGSRRLRLSRRSSEARRRSEASWRVRAGTRLESACSCRSRRS